MYVVAKILVWVLTHCWFFLKKEGRENIPAEGPAILVCNHIHLMDVACIIAMTKRQVRFMAKKELFDNKLIGWFLTKIGTFPISRGDADISGIRNALKVIKEGGLLCIFPEGTRIRSREIKPEVHGGFALIAQMGKAPVNPLAICGWSDITPAGKKIMRPKKCWIRAGKAISLSNAPAGLKRTERLAWFESEAMNRVYAMRDELCAEHPGRF